MYGGDDFMTHYHFQVIADVSKIYPNDMEVPFGGVDDMTKLSYLHEPGVLQNLSMRYEHDEIYVSSSPRR